MTYDFSFDRKSVWGLLGGSVALCALLFFTGLMVGVGWGEKREAGVAGAAQGAQAGAQTAAQAVQTVAAQPASVAFAPRVAPPPQEPALYDDPAQQGYAARVYGAQDYAPRDYAPQAGTDVYEGSRGYGSPGYYGPPRYAAQGPAASASGAAAAAPTQSSAAQGYAAPAPAAYASGRREAERLSARGVDPDPRLVAEAGGASQESAGAASPGYSVQVGAYLEEKEARRVVEELENKGYTPTLFSGLDAEARTWYAVRIGSYSNTKDAGQAAGNFERQEKRKTTVRPAGSL